MKVADKYLGHLALQGYTAQLLIEGVRLLELERSFLDDSGELTEVGRVSDQGTLLQLPDFRIKQITCTRLEPGAIKAWHLHQKQTDLWFVPGASRLLIGLVDLREGSKTKEKVMRIVGGGAKRQLVVIPPGVAHGMANPYSEPMELIYLTDHYFDPKDEYRLPWDYFGADFWQLQRS